MTDAVALAAYALLPLIGIAVWRLDAVRALALDGRLAVSGAAGALITAGVMSVMSLVRLEWSLVRLLVVLAIPAAVGVRAAALQSRSTLSWRTPAVAAVVLVLVVVVYGLLTGRMTIGDLLFFWGPKGVHFHQAGSIDVVYLRDWNNYLQHRDYPPLLPLLFAWSAIWSGEFSWWAALLLTALCLGAITSLVRCFVRDNLASLLVASVLAACFVHAFIGGGADPLLLLFETLAVCALVFVRDPRAQTILAAIGLAGAVMTKVEGASFVIAVVLALLLDRRPWRRIVAVVIPAVILLGGWLAFVVSAGLLDTYRGAGELSFRWFGAVMGATFEAASFGIWWIPWIAPATVVLLGSVRRARLPLMIAALSLGSVIYFYLKSPTDPTVLWIPVSATRVLLTPVLMLLIAAATAHAPWLDEENPAPQATERDSEEST